MIPGVTILLSMTIFLNTVQMIIPITSDSPLIGEKFSFIDNVSMPHHPQIIDGNITKCCHYCYTV